MVLAEQKYTNLNRIYYHGFNPDKAKKLSCNEFYLTTSFPYAAENAGPNGTVAEFFLAKESNIFSN